MRYLVTGDTHLTDRPKDEYRFGLFPWLKDQQRKHKPDATFILGDLCDSKDRHSAKLVNRIVKELLQLDKPVVILKGNHDYIDPSNPFFGFLNAFEGIYFINTPMVVEGAMCIPHIRDENEFVKVCHEAKGRKFTYLFLHQSLEGAITETGGRMSGFSTSAIAEIAQPSRCYAGDIHKPQTVGPVQYVGAPYHIRFGDDYDPRVLLLDGGEKKSLYYECPRKWSLTIRTADDIIRNKALFEGDHVKVTIEMAREEAVEWKSIKTAVIAACREKGLELTGPDLKVNGITPNRSRIPSDKASTPKDVITTFCKVEKLSSAVKEAGLCLL